MDMEMMSDDEVEYKPAVQFVGVSDQSAPGQYFTIDLNDARGLLPAATSGVETNAIIGIDIEGITSYNDIGNDNQRLCLSYQIEPTESTPNGYSTFYSGPADVSEIELGPSDENVQMEEEPVVNCIMDLKPDLNISNEEARVETVSGGIPTQEFPVLTDSFEESSRNKGKGHWKKPDKVCVNIKIEDEVTPANRKWFADFGDIKPQEDVDPGERLMKRFANSIKGLRDAVCHPKTWPSIDEANIAIELFLGVKPIRKEGHFRPLHLRIEITFVSHLKSTASSTSLQNPIVIKQEHILQVPTFTPLANSIFPQEDPATESTSNSTPTLKRKRIWKSRKNPSIPEKLIPEDIPKTSNEVDMVEVNPNDPSTTPAKRKRVYPRKKKVVTETPDQTDVLMSMPILEKYMNMNRSEVSFDLNCQNESTSQHLDGNPIKPKAKKIKRKIKNVKLEAKGDLNLISQPIETPPVIFTPKPKKVRQSRKKIQLNGSMLLDSANSSTLTTEEISSAATDTPIQKKSSKKRKKVVIKKEPVPSGSSPGISDFRQLSIPTSVITSIPPVALNPPISPALDRIETVESKLFRQPISVSPAGIKVNAMADQLTLETRSDTDNSQEISTSMANVLITRNHNPKYQVIRFEQLSEAGRIGIDQARLDMRNSAGVGSQVYVLNPPINRPRSSEEIENVNHLPQVPQCTTDIDNASRGLPSVASYSFNDVHKQVYANGGVGLPLNPVFNSLQQSLKPRGNGLQTESMYRLGMNNQSKHCQINDPSFDHVYEPDRKQDPSSYHGPQPSDNSEYTIASPCEFDNSSYGVGKPVITPSNVDTSMRSQENIKSELINDADTPIKSVPAQESDGAQNVGLLPTFPSAIIQKTSVPDKNVCPPMSAEQIKMLSVLNQQMDCTVDGFVPKKKRKSRAKTIPQILTKCSDIGQTTASGDELPPQLEIEGVKIKGPHPSNGQQTQPNKVRRVRKTLSKKIKPCVDSPAESSSIVPKKGRPKLQKPSTNSDTAQPTTAKARVPKSAKLVKLKANKRDNLVTHMPSLGVEITPTMAGTTEPLLNDIGRIETMEPLQTSLEPMQTKPRKGRKKVGEKSKSANEESGVNAIPKSLFPAEKANLEVGNATITETPKPKVARSNAIRSSLSGVAGLPSRKWYPSQEEQDLLYKDLKFVIEADQINKEPLEVTLWRIYDRNNFLLQKYAAIDLKGRIFHKPTAVFRIVEDGKDRTFFTKYYPVYTVCIHDTPKLHIIQYYHVDKIQQCLLKMEETTHLYTDFKVLIEAIVVEIIKWPPGFIKSKVLADSEECEEYYKSSWDNMEAAVYDRVRVIAHERNWSSQLIAPFQIYPLIKFTRFNTKDIERRCVGCKPIRRGKAFYRVKFIGKPYDQYSFEDLTEDSLINPQEELYFCNPCTPDFKILDKLLNHKWCVYRAIRNRVTNDIGELGPGEMLEIDNEVETILSDHEWLLQSFIEFQVALAEADICIERLKKGSRRQTMTFEST